MQLSSPQNPRYLLSAPLFLVVFVIMVTNAMHLSMEPTLSTYHTPLLAFLQR